MDWGNIFSRAAWTFGQTAIASFVVVGIAFNPDALLNAAITAIVAGLAAALSVIKTALQEQAAARAVAV